jgi:hypothetical protein
MNVNSISLQQNISASYDYQQSASEQINAVRANQDTVTISNTGRQLSISRHSAPIPCELIIYHRNYLSNL